MVFVDPKNDLAFKKIFGDSKKTEILMSFLNAVLELPKKIVKVTIISPYQTPQIKNLKDTSLDVKAVDSLGREFIVEMQVESNDNWGKRAMYYLSKSFVNQIQKSEDYMKLKPVYFLGILNFKQYSGKHYLSRHILINQSTGNHDLKEHDYNFIELPKFKKREDQLDNIIDKWIFFLKNAGTLDHIPNSTTEEALKEAYDIANKNQWTLKELDTYDYIGMKEGDKISQIETAMNKGIAEEKKRSTKIINQAKEAEVKAKEAEVKANKEKTKIEKQLTVAVELLAKKLNISIKEAQDIIT